MAAQAGGRQAAQGQVNGHGPVSGRLRSRGVSRPVRKMRAKGDCASAGLQLSQLLLNPQFLSLQILDRQIIAGRALLFGGNLFVQVAVLCSELTDPTIERHGQSPVFQHGT
jgi:hypothetical protein